MAEFRSTVAFLIIFYCVLIGAVTAAYVMDTGRISDIPFLLKELGKVVIVPFSISFLAIGAATLSKKI
jgi:hypothetical protein